MNCPGLSERILHLTLICLLAGCATITSGTTQSITVDTMNVTGASCKGVDKKGKNFFWPSTPGNTTVQKGDGPMTITCEKKGYKKTVNTTEEAIAGATIGNIILGGGIGILVDAVSGAAQEYPTLVRFPMEPLLDASDEMKEKYDVAKTEWIEEKKRIAEAEKAESEDLDRVESHYAPDTISRGTPTTSAGSQAGRKPAQKKKTALSKSPIKKAGISKRYRFSTTPIPLRFKKIQDGHNDIAVIIGNANYSKKGKGLPNVWPAYADAEGFRKYAIEGLGIWKENIIFLRNATGKQFDEIFGTNRSHKGQLFNWVKPRRSRVYVYYAGHGAPSREGKSAYIVGVGASAKDMELHGYPLNLLYENLGKLRAKKVTVLLEASFSGNSQSGELIPRASSMSLGPRIPLTPPNVTVISAGGPDQIASWEKDYSHSLFTKYFLKGMSGEADGKDYGNGDGTVALSELKAYLKDTVTYYARRYYGRDQRVQIK